VGEAIERAGMQLLAHVVSPRQLSSLVATFQTEFLVLDVDPPGSEALSQLCGIHRASPKTEILLAVGTLTDRTVDCALFKGARGFVSRDSPRDEYVRALRAVQRGEIWLGRERLARAMTSLIDRLDVASHAAGSPDALSPRESEIVRLIARGWTNKEIARQLGTSDKTVKAHLSHIFAKLGIRRRMQLGAHPNPEAESAG
jgi:DNA-binding NarL/FixJ family response regulator